MTSRFPQAPPPVRPRQPRQPQLPTNLTPSSSSISPESLELYRKRRNGFWAVGVAVIVGAGAILGAQLKDSKQERDKYASIMANHNSTPTSPGADVNDARIATSSVGDRSDEGLGKEKQSKGPQVDSEQPGGNHSGAESGFPVERGSSPAQRQVQQHIAVLETRRGVLMTEKLDLETKLERVRGRIRKEEETKARFENGGVKVDR